MASEELIVFSSAMMYLGLTRVATGLCEERRIADVESLGTERGGWRGDFLGREGDRLVFLFVPSEDFCEVNFAGSSLACLAEGFGPGQANLIIHFLGAGASVGGGVTGLSTTGTAACLAALAAASFFPSHMKVIHLFFGAWTAGCIGCAFGETPMTSDNGV